MKCDNCYEDAKILYSLKVETSPNGYGRRMDCCGACMYRLLEND